MKQYKIDIVVKEVKRLNDNKVRLDKLTHMSENLETDLGVVLKLNGDNSPHTISLKGSEAMSVLNYIKELTLKGIENSQSILENL